MSAGYFGYSKSNNAIEAERAGKFPATRAAQVLGLPAKFVTEICSWATHGEWHHSSKHFNQVAYFDTNEIAAWREGDPELVEQHGAFQQVFAAWKSATALAAAQPAILYSPVSVAWLEWSGTRSHPKAKERSADNASVIDAGGKFVTVKFADGSTMKKGKDTNGFHVVGADGRQIYFRP